ncbi:AAA family ATPase [Streptomyces sp. NPDC050400]|uniref:AAA family ATPase n=1 Tax=Streptomyces sp. NPDC050400 TaxID=3365610 RepID=UPI0037BDEFF9
MTEQYGAAGAPPAWRVFRAVGHRAPVGEGPRLPEPPRWRRFAGGPVQPLPDLDDTRTAERRLGEARDLVQLRDEEIDVVNAAILLRRPLLVTGPPGVGKSTLAYLIAQELGLGRVLQWGIVSRTTLSGGLYSYDAIGRAQAIAAWRAGADGAQSGEPAPRMGDFLTLGPLGTALLPFEQPRVLLIDELDKCDVDLPHDLLHVMENGAYDVPELMRSADPEASVFTDDPGQRTTVLRGRVECHAFPIVVITSNGEREFPLPLRRRCLPLELRLPSREQLVAIVSSHLHGSEDVVGPLLDQFERRVQDGGTHSVDQLLNAVQLVTSGGFQHNSHGRKLVELLLRDLAKGR